MPFFQPEDESDPLGPLSLAEGLSVTPEEAAADPEGSLLASAFRQENPIGSFVSSFTYDREKDFDPEYRPWEDIQGTEYETYSDRFVGARDKADVLAMKQQIDQEVEDRRVVGAAGGLGIVASIGAAILSPTSLLPGGAVVKGARGVSIARTGLSVGLSAGAATAVDEAVLQSTQQIRTAAESAAAIGGSVILGGALGAGVGALSAREFKRSAVAAEQFLGARTEFDDGLRSVGAAENRRDLSLRREKLFQTLNKIPGLRLTVRSDPILRGLVSDNMAARQATADLVDTPLQFAANERGETVRVGSSVEGAIKDRELQELARSVQYLARSFAEYRKDGPVGMVGRITNPITSRYENLVGKSQKLSEREFVEEVGKAMRRGDKHPIPQVQAAADALRQNVFDKIKDEAIELGMFDEGLNLDHGGSYFTRSYNVGKINQHYGDGSADDILPVLVREFQERRARAIDSLAEDSTVDELETAQMQLRQQARTAQTALNRARRRARDKRDRAKSAMTREMSVGRVTSALRKAFNDRSVSLREKLLEGDDLDTFKDMLADARALDRLEPDDLLKTIRQLGGIRDPRRGGLFDSRTGDWTRNAQRTEIEDLFDSRAAGIRRNDGLSLDEMRGALEERGFIEEGSTEADMMDLLARAARGEKVYAITDQAEELARFEAAQEFAAAMDELGIDITKPIDQIINRLPGMSRSQKITRAKSQEAGRSGNKAGRAASQAEARLFKAMDRLEDAKARLDEIDSEVAPRVRDEIRGAQQELAGVQRQLKTAKAAREKEQFYASLDDAEVETAVRDTIDAIRGLKPGEHSYRAAMSSPTRARVLDVADEVLEPWLESNAYQVLADYHRSMVPDMEIIRKFGDLDMTEAKRQIIEEGRRLQEAAKGQKAKAAAARETEDRLRDLDGMRDRLRNIYGVPADPNNFFVQAGRTGRTLSYMGLLGGMTLSALPDVATVLGRNGIETAFAAKSLLSQPKRFGMSLSDAYEFSAAGEWWLNNRAVATAELFDPYGAGTRLERVLGGAASQFGVASGMIPWNMGWKSVAVAMTGSKLAKAADAMRAGTATKAQKLALAENDIAPWMAERIARMIDQHADKGTGARDTWLPQAGQWEDREAFEAFRKAMRRESDLQIITPGQDRPLIMSTEAGKFFLQLRSFSMSAHHRILLSGIQRYDSGVLAQVVTMLTLGALVSHIKADLGGYERKEGGKLWEDAIDRSGLAGWLMEPYNVASAVSGGRLSLTGEPVSRYQSRSDLGGFLGPSVDIGLGMAEGASAIARGEHTDRDVDKLLNPVPGNNLIWLFGMTDRVSNAITKATGGQVRE